MDTAYLKTDQMASDLVVRLNTGANENGITITSSDGGGFDLSKHRKLVQWCRAYIRVLGLGGDEVETGSYTGGSPSARQRDQHQPGTAVRGRTGCHCHPQAGVQVRQPGGDASFNDRAGAETTNVIQALDSASFQVGSDATVNSSGITYYWFGFAGAQVETGSYAGDGDDDGSKTVSTGSVTPVHAWVKHDGAYDLHFVPGGDEMTDCGSWLPNDDFNPGNTGTVPDICNIHTRPRIASGWAAAGSRSAMGTLRIITGTVRLTTTWPWAMTPWAVNSCC